MARFAGITALGAAALLFSCGEGGTPVDPAGQVTPLNTLVFTRADQSVIAFPAGAQLLAWCGPWEPGLVATPGVHVIFFAAPPAAAAYWRLTAVVADITPGQPLAFPNSFIWDQPDGAHLFVGDPPNELSTQEGGSSGSITFQQLNCTAGGAVEFSLAAVVGSEFGGGPPVAVTGSVRAAIGASPFTVPPLDSTAPSH